MLHCKVDICYSSLGLKSSLVFTDPQTTHHIESVVRQKHPAEFSDEFDCMADVVYIFIVEKVAKVKA